MSGNNISFNTEPSVKIVDNKIIINGHFSDNVRCAKLTMLCEMYGADIKNGYAELPYNKKFLEDYKKYINSNLNFSVLATLLLTLLAAATVGGVGWAANANYADTENSNTRKWLKENYPELTDAEITELINQYGDKAPQHMFDFGAWGNQANQEGLEQAMEDLQKAYSELGYAPEDLTAEDLSRIAQEAYAEIDSENQKLMDLYEQTFQNSKNMLNTSLAENSAMFGEYKNQLLTNEAMRQQAIAGSTRFELDRQQRNAITRGASAAQRLVANINTQLGLQAQSAQQSLDTSNALAQNLLAHRQAQQGIRNSYMDAQNQYNSNIASTIAGSAERRFSYGRNRKKDAVEDNNLAWDTWNRRVGDYFRGNSTGEGIYRRQYGSGTGQSKGY